MPFFYTSLCGAQSPPLEACFQFPNFFRYTQKTSSGYQPYDCGNFFVCLGISLRRHLLFIAFQCIMSLSKNGCIFSVNCHEII